MKRPSLALLALLVSLAMGLAPASPRRAEATTFGELFCAIEIVTPPRHEAYDDHCPDCPYADEYADECPRVCTPPGMPAAEDVDDRAPAAAATDASAQIELNPADSTDATDCQSAWEDEYGQYYGDFYNDEEAYSDEYTSEYEAAPAETAALDSTAPVLLEEESPAEPDFRYGEGYNPWASVTSEEASAPSAADLIVEPSDAPAATVEPYDLYGRQVGDEYYGYDFEEEEAAPQDCDYESQYEYDYESVNEAVEESPAPAVNETEATNDSGTSYYEEYYPDYYGELYGDESVDEAATSEEQRDLTTEYDAAYDEAVYGERADAGDAPSADAIIDELFDPTPTADSDLPWADEVPAVEERTAEKATEVADRPALESEYGSDYAEEYYRALFGEETFDELNESASEEETELPAPAYDETFDLFFDPCRDGDCHTPRALNVTQLVVDCGRQIAAWTASLELVSMRLHSACLQLAELPLRIDHK